MWKLRKGVYIQDHIATHGPKRKAVTAGKERNRIETKLVCLKNARDKKIKKLLLSKYWVHNYKNANTLYVHWSFT
jgi:hypothetical protein